jgi:hypothetical protein
MSVSLSPVEKLRLEHDTEPFDCGKEEKSGKAAVYKLIRQGSAGNPIHLHRQYGHVVVSAPILEILCQNGQTLLRKAPFQ